MAHEWCFGRLRLMGKSNKNLFGVHTNFRSSLKQYVRTIDLINNFSNELRCVDAEKENKRRRRNETENGNCLTETAKEEDAKKKQKWK